MVMHLQRVTAAQSQVLVSGDELSSIARYLSVIQGSIQKHEYWREEMKGFGGIGGQENNHVRILPHEESGYRKRTKKDPALSLVTAWLTKWQEASQ